MVTFGGSGLDRAAEIRSRALDGLGASGSEVVALWRGKLLTAGTDGAALMRLPPSSRLLTECRAETVFVGRDGDRLVFAADVSDWEPPEMAETVGAFFDPSVQIVPDLDPAGGFRELRTIMTGLSVRDAEIAATAKALLGWHRTHRFCAVCGAPSHVAMGGWQRDCPDCGSHHFPRTDPVVIMLITHGNSVLLGRSPGWPEGMFSLLAGFIEPGETMEAAVRREVFEEAGVPVGRVEYLASQPWAFPSSLMLGCRGEALSREITIDPAEIEEALWLGRQEAMSVLAGQHARLRQPRPGAIAQFLLRNWLADRLD